MSRAIFLMPNMGNNVFLKLSEEFGYQTDLKDSSKEFSAKMTLRCVIGLVAIRFFSNIGIFYNSSLAFSKGCLGLLSIKKEQDIGGITAFQFGQDFKRHMACVIYDLAILHFSTYFIIFYILSPNEMQKFGKRMHDLILTNYSIKADDVQ